MWRKSCSCSDLSQQAPKQKQQPCRVPTTIILLLVHFVLQVFTFEGGRMKAVYYPSCNAFDRSFPCNEYSIFHIACSSFKRILKLQFLFHVENPFLECFRLDTFFNTVIFGKNKIDLPIVFVLYYFRNFSLR